LKRILVLFFVVAAYFGMQAQAPKLSIPTAKPLSSVAGVNIAVKDTSNALTSDTLVADSTKKQSRDIETTIVYSAEDSIIIDAQTKQAFLYRDAKVEYGKMNMTAHNIDMDYNTNIVNASFGKDSLDNKIGVPIFKEGGDAYEAGGIKYNYKTKRGLVKAIVTKQNDGVIRGRVVKKEPNNTMYVDGASYSTCDLREPHFCIKMMQIKVIPKKKIVTRAFNMQIDDIPTPIAFPFGVFPIPKRRGTGLIFPSYGESQSQGFFLSNLGFYWAVNDYIGFKILTNQFSIGGIGNGNYTADLDYKSRYSFQGKFNASYSNLKNNPDDPSKFSQSEQVWVRWNHSTLSKGTGRFSASVNAGSTNFNRVNTLNVTTRTLPSFQSALNYSNVIKKTPFSYAISANQNQNISTGEMNFVLPQASLNMNRIYPLKNVPFINKADWVKKLNFAYSSSFANRVSNLARNTSAQTLGYRLNNADLRALDTNATNYFSDSARINKFYRTDTLTVPEFFTKFNTNSKWTVTHNIPISTTFKLFKFFNFTPSASYGETWYNTGFNYNYIKETNNIKVDTNFSFKDGTLARKNTVSGGVSVTTRIFGTFYIKKFGIEAIRHVLIPTIGYSYSPVFKNYFQKIDTGGTGLPLYLDRFTGLRAADPSRLKDSETINFSLGNTFEAKIVDKNDTSKTEKKFKKQMLLDNVSISNNYNLRADSFNLGNFSISARTKLFGLFDINFNTTFDPYYYRSLGKDPRSNYQSFKKTKYLAWNDADNGEAQPLNFNWQKNQGFGRLVNMNLAISTRFASKKGNSKKILSYVNGTDYQFFFNPMAAPYVDFDLPWTFNINYIMTYNKYSIGQPSANAIFTDRSTYSNRLSFSGDFTPTPKWKISYTTGYDFNPTVGRDNITNTVINVSRDLHCWYATFSTGLYPTNFQYYLFTIGIKSPSLSDVKIPRRSTPITNF